MGGLKFILTNIRCNNVFKGEVHLSNMEIYGGLQKEKVLEIYNFIIKKGLETGYGQRKLFRIVKKDFNVEIKESTIANWIFQ